MSICRPCIKTEKISLCVDSLVIGEAPEATTEYIVWFRNLATNGLFGYTATSDIDKALTLNFPEGFPLAGNTAFEMWINLPGDSVESKVELMVGVQIGYCFHVTAEDNKPMVNGYLDSPVTQTLTVKEV
jgi:hypothetical protein